MYRTPGRKPDAEPEPQYPSFFVVWPAKEEDHAHSTYREKAYVCTVQYKKFDTLEEAQKHVELRNKRDSRAQVYMFYGFMAVPTVTVNRQVIEHVAVSYEVK